MKFVTLFFLFFFSASLQGYDQNITLDLLHPCYEDGVLKTVEGGVLTGEHLKVQAREIVYTKKLNSDPPTYTLCAQGDLLIHYCDTVIVGDAIFYDFLENRGTIINGRTAFAPWYIGGEKIILCSNGELIVENGYITTSEGEEREVVLTARKLVVSPSKELVATSILFKVQELPLFYFPTLALDLSTTPRSPFSVTAGWGGFLGPYLSLRYHALSFGNWDLFLRGDAYMGKGFGGGIETEYESDRYCETLYTRNYYAHDISIDDPKRRDRYRFSGVYDFATDCNKAWANLIYDVLSDDEMANDFPPYKFDLGTAGKTELTLHRETDFWIANAITKVRVNSFQSINQELPTFEMSFRPFYIFNTNFIAENLFRGSYLSYVFSDQVTEASDFEAWRLEAQPKIYYPTNIGPLKITPEAGFIGIAYSNSPSHQAVGQALLDLNCYVNTEFSRFFGCMKHAIFPYAHYHFYSHPRVKVDNYYVFSIKDGYNHLNLVRFGVKNGFYVPCFSEFVVDLWANAFLNTEHTLPQVIPKGYLNIDYQITPFLYFGGEGAWNFAHKQLDFYNVRCDWTVAENLAFGVEYRHRGRFDWRKANFYDFVLEASRKEEALLLSPLSDRRDIALARIFYRFHPNWESEIQFRRGWNRIGQPPYLEYRVSIGKTIFEHYFLCFTYEKREADHRVTLSFKLDPSPPKCN